MNRRCEAVDSLQQFPERGAITPEDGKLRHLLFGQSSDVYRIIYRVEKRRAVIDVLHIRHGARAPFSGH
ncbi:MAG TPA: type II toxin-antitoxin system RelE/ParE family toxin [Candidatus Methylomirabilis sp.]|nr:type II toxin-antitoxin system RelE/ParE family toxin [Candidatus Methylomirabilis sp.]